jgi:hypothetical protein
MLPKLPEGLTYEVLDFGLHLKPENLKKELQIAIDRASKQAEIILLGYGLCSMAVAGLKANNCTVVVPRVDDCIAIFLGSRQSYMQQVGYAPGTYYLTKGWIEVYDTPLEEYNRMVERYGEKRAMYMMRLMLKNYTRIAYIDTGHKNQEHYRSYARKMAEKFDLKYEEIRGSDTLIKKLLFGPWDEDFVIALPGQTITYADFKSTATSTSNLEMLNKLQKNISN